MFLGNKSKKFQVRHVKLTKKCNELHFFFEHVFCTYSKFITWAKIDFLFIICYCCSLLQNCTYEKIVLTLIFSSQMIRLISSIFHSVLFDILNFKSFKILNHL